MEHVTYFEITANEIFVHYMHKRQALKVKRVKKYVCAPLFHTLHICFYIFSTTLNVLSYVLPPE